MIGKDKSKKIKKKIAPDRFGYLPQKYLKIISYNEENLELKAFFDNDLEKIYFLKK